MRKLILAAIAALTFGGGSAYVTQASAAWQFHSHPAYSDDAGGAA